VDVRYSIRSAYPLHLCFCGAACFFTLACLVLERASAAIVVDPLSVGATDLSFQFFDFVTPVSPVASPVPDPFNAPSGVTALTIGRTQDGTLEVNGGSSANLYAIWIGESAQGGDGQLTVRGAGTKLSAISNISMGGNSLGRFDILEGAVVEAREIQLSSHQLGTQSELNLSGPNTRMDIVDSVSVGINGRFMTNGGALLEATGVNISKSIYYSIDGSVAVAAVDGTDSQWLLSGDLKIGELGDGELTISNGAEVIAKSTRLGNYSPDVVGLTLAGGTLRTDGLYFAGNQIAGTGNVFAKGMVADLPLTFDASHGLVQTVPIETQPAVHVELDVTSAGTLGAGYLGNGVLTIADGRAIESVEGVLGHGPLSYGRANIVGEGSKWTVSGNLNVGVEGSGELAIGAGAKVEVGGELLLARNAHSPYGHVRFDGGELSTMTLSSGVDQLLGTGTILTESVYLDGNLVFDQPGEASGPIVLNDLPDQNVTIELANTPQSVFGIGYRTGGSVEVRNGAQLASASSSIGKRYEGSGAVLVTGPGSEWNLWDNLWVGTGSQEAKGELRVLDQGLVTSRVLILQAGGSVEVAGIGSRLEAESLHINGDQGVSPASLHIHSGGVVSIDSPSAYGSSPITGTILVEGEGSQLRFPHHGGFNGMLVRIRDHAELLVGEDQLGGGDAGISNGTLHLDGGTIDLSGGKFDANDGNFIFERGLLKNLHEFTGELVQLGGRIESGFDRFTVTGAYVQDEDATIRVLMENRSSPERIRVNGVAVLEGTIEVEALLELPTSVSTSEEVFKVLHATRGIIGSFESWVLPELAAGLGWSVRQTFDRIDLEVIAGDFNGDLVVDAADYTVWRDALYDYVEKGTGADGDRNGYIDDRDFSLWKEFFGRTLIAPTATGTPSATSVGVPEPASCGLLVFLPIALLNYRGCRRPSVR
jgi:T5SS/PEP-CTERM-associated repeat protein